ncbi:MAG: endonuclease [Ignavibacteria bacterium]|nr:endonuclease [Ignavibacteria bacterium]
MPFRYGIVIVYFLSMYLPSFAQECPTQFGDNILDFGSVQTRTTTIKKLWLKTSPTANPIVIRSASVVSGENVFKVKLPSQILINPNDSTEIEVDFKSNQNINFSASAFLQVQCTASGATYSLPISLRASCNYPDTVYNFTQNLVGAQLFQSLSAYLQNQVVLDYKQARTAFFSQLDNRNGEVECVYTGRTIKTTTIPDPNQFNCEHTWPQSKGSDVPPPESDIYHLYPSWETANTKRSNFPFGNVTQNISWQDGGSKLGQATGSNEIVFEPRDKHKGNVARSLFYFATRYGNRKGTNDTQGFLTSMESTLRQWCVLDTVDALEMQRNEGIAKIQQRRNPYIDHPELIDRIYNIGNQPGYPKYPQPVASDTFLTFGNVGQLALYVHNTGNDAAVIQTVDFRNASGDIFTLAQFDTTIAPGGRARVVINSNKINGSATARVRFAAGVPAVNVFISTLGTSSIASLEGDAPIFAVEQNVPNPTSNTMTQITLHVPPQTVNATSLKFYQLDGREVFDATGLIEWSSGGKGVVQLGEKELFQCGQFAMYRLTAPGHSMAKVMIVR